MLSSISEHKDTMLCLMEKISFHKLWVGMSYSPIAMVSVKYSIVYKEAEREGWGVVMF